MCLIEGCAKKVTIKSRQLCDMHYRRLLRNGDPLVVRRDLSKTEEQRFWEKVNRTDGCWEWKGSTVMGGYGKFARSGSRKLDIASRVSWELHFGHIPEGMFVCHRCDNPPCVRPNHLFLGDTKQNADDMIRKGRHRSGLRLTLEEVRSIIESPGPAKNIAQRFGVSLNTVHRYRRGEGGVSAWKM